MINYYKNNKLILNLGCFAYIFLILTYSVFISRSAISDFWPAFLKLAPNLFLIFFASLIFCNQLFYKKVNNTNKKKSLILFGMTGGILTALTTVGVSVVIVLFFNVIKYNFKIFDFDTCFFSLYFDV